MTSGQTRFPIAPSIFKFAQYGKSGAWISELLPYTARMVDDIAIIRSHAYRGHQSRAGHHVFPDRPDGAGRPCIGSWLSYGLGSMNQNLPTFVVLQAKHYNPKANVQAISARMWSAGFLSGQYAGVSLRSGGDPVLFINNPDGVPTEVRRAHARFARRNESPAIRASWAIPRPARASRNTRWRSACRLRCRN